MEFGIFFMLLLLRLSLLRDLSEFKSSGKKFKLLFPKYKISRDMSAPIESGNSVISFPLRSNVFNLKMGKEFW